MTMEDVLNRTLKNEVDALLSVKQKYIGANDANIKKRLRKEACDRSESLMKMTTMLMQVSNTRHIS